MCLDPVRVQNITWDQFTFSTNIIIRNDNIRVGGQSVTHTQSRRVTKYMYSVSQRVLDCINVLHYI